MCYGGQVQTEGRKEQSVKKMGDGSQEKAEVPCDSQDHTAKERREEEDYWQGLFRKLEETQIPLFLQLHLLAGHP